MRYAQPPAVTGPAVRVTTLLRLSCASIRDTHTRPPVASATMRSRDPRIPVLSCSASWWDHFLMDKDDPEQRIADLERQLAEKQRGADLPPAGPYQAQPHSGSARGVAERRFVASAVPSGKQILISYLWSFAALIGLFAVVYTLWYVFPATRAFRVAYPVLILVGIVIASFLGSRRLNRKMHICVTSDGLTVKQRPGDVYSFSDATLGAWGVSGDKLRPSGTALHLQSGPHRFILGGREHRLAPGTRLDAPPTRSVDAAVRASDFDELLTLAGRPNELHE